MITSTRGLTTTWPHALDGSAAMPASRSRRSGPRMRDTRATLSHRLQRVCVGAVALLSVPVAGGLAPAAIQGHLAAHGVVVVEPRVAGRLVDVVDAKVLPAAAAAVE